MLDAATITAIADELAQAQESKTTIQRLTQRFTEMSIEDSYAVQKEFCRMALAQGRRRYGHKIGLTSKPMQEATGITEPDYGTIFADQVFDTGSVLDYAQFVGLRVEVELAFVLRSDLIGPDVSLVDVLNATEYVQPAMEVLSSRIQMEGRTIVDTIADNAALGAMVLGGNPVRVDSVDLRRVGALLYRNESVEDSGLAGAVLDHPARGVAWLANTLSAHGEGLHAGETILAGSFTRPMWVHKGDTVTADYGELGVISCRFI